MKIQIESSNQYKKDSFNEKNDLVKFLARELKELSKKNLRMPIKLFHL